MGFNSFTYDNSYSIPFQFNNFVTHRLNATLTYDEYKSNNTYNYLTFSNLLLYIIR